MAVPDVTVVPATEAHARELAAHMRPADAAEVQASIATPPLEAVLASMAVSEGAWTALFNGRVAGVFGVAPWREAQGTLLGGTEVGVVWLLTSDAVDSHPRAFLRASASVLGALLRRFPALVNAVDARHTAALRWVRWLGFDVADAVPFGVEGRPFHPIAIRSRHV